MSYVYVADIDDEKVEDIDDILKNYDIEDDNHFYMIISDLSDFTDGYYNIDHLMKILNKENLVKYLLDLEKTLKDDYIYDDNISIDDMSVNIYNFKSILNGKRSANKEVSVCELIDAIRNKDYNKFNNLLKI